MSNATRYNDAQSYTPAFIRHAQATCGISPSPEGVWRACDVPAVEAFQDANGLTPDGLVGLQTARAIRRVSGVLGRAPVEVWWDSGPLERIGSLSRLGVSGLAFMLNRSSRKFQFEPNWRYRDGDLRKLTDATRRRGMRVSLTTWVRPNISQIDAVERYLDHIIPFTGAAAIEMELEGNWKKANVWDEDFSSLDDAALYLVAMLARLRASHGVDVEVTTFIGHGELDPERATVATLSRDIAIWPQVYSIQKDGATRWGSARSPGHLQALWMQRLATWWPGRPLFCGLAGFGQRWGAVLPEEAIARASTAAILHGATAQRVWSAKHARPDGYVEKFLQERRDACGS